MAEYISITDLLKKFNDIVYPEFNLASDVGKMFLECRKAIITTPTANVVEVKHGYWIKRKRIGLDVFQYACSECGEWADAEFPYCHCGAKMDGTDTSVGSNGRGAE